MNRIFRLLFNESSLFHFKVLKYSLHMRGTNSACIQFHLK